MMFSEVSVGETEKDEPTKEAGTDPRGRKNKR